MKAAVLPKITLKYEDEKQVNLHFCSINQMHFIMKKNVLVFGLISGLIITTMMVISIAMCYSRENFEGNVVVGYAAMILAFSLIFIGVRNFRNKYNNGVISFGKAFKIGLYITLIASTMYVVVWLIDYYLFIPDFMDKYTAHVLRQAENDGAGAAELAKKAEEMAKFKQMYTNPVMVVLLTYAEVLPIGLVISLISAAILKRRSGGTAVAAG
ncbi:uncharacterized protein DUF4199 [Chitinophaga japonensis]|uniref:Uncharacterized protein DUF4199 n=2 Tax=Chitinophaga japonensis TaxID=104662 RepID=A0A562SS08_CHIJA|nr:uncharacterized protein DUF4199 [Chitinophaga japonensis]